MHNQVTLVGRLTSTPESSENKNCIITIACPRSYKNELGIYDTDFIDVTLKGSIATNTIEYCKKGDLVGIKGRIETTIETTIEENTKTTKIIAEEITFLSSTKNED